MYHSITKYTITLLLQFTEEKMGRAERTENDPQFGILSDKTDKTKNYTEKLVKVRKK